NHRTTDAPGHLSREVGGGGPPTNSTEGGINERHHRVEVGTRYWAEHQDDGLQPRSRRCSILEQLQADVARRELWRGDARSDDHGGQKGTTEQFGGQATPKSELDHHSTHRPEGGF